ncbi:MAG TPA: ATP-binding protein [Candidatus Angelobacter sp.]|nr:ATP-binding protein [Candidatus Angelobacter sp.]
MISEQTGGLGAALAGDPQRVIDALAGVLDTLPISVIVVEGRAPFRVLYQNPRSAAVVPEERRPALGKPWQELWEGVSEAGVPALLGEVAASGVSRHLSGWEFVHGASGDGARRVTVWDWMVSPIAGVTAGHPGYLLITALDRTEHRLAEEREQARRLAEQQRFDELALVRQVAQALSATLDEQQAAMHVVQIAATIVTAPGAPPRRSSLLRLDGDRLVRIAEYDRDGPRLGQTTYTLADHPQLAEVAAGEQPVTGSFDGDLDVPEATRERVRDGGLRSYALAPVHIGEAIFGVITIGARDGFDEAQMQRLTAVAHISGLALGNAMRHTLARDHAERIAALERAKSDFLNLASHELRGPLTVVRGYMSMLSDGSLGELSRRTADVLPTVMERLEAMNRIVDQIIDTARLADHESAPLRLQAVDLRDAVGAAVGEVAVRCAADDERRVALVSVRDGGLGIAADDLPRIFTRFGRIVTPENSAIAGTGLGLYLARDTVRRHRGDIAVDSRLGEGSTFTITLPLLDAGG